MPLPIARHSVLVPNRHIALVQWSLIAINKVANNFFLMRVGFFCRCERHAETLRRWQGRFAAERAEVLRQGFDERFIRTWDFYLAYCEAAFTEQNVDVFQYTLAHE